MFNRYWRDYPWFMQVVMLMLLFFTLASFFTYLILTILPTATGITSKEFLSLGPDSSLRVIRTGLLAQALSHIGTFTIPALLFAIFTHPRIGEYLGLRMPKNPLHWLLSAGIVLGILPVFIWGEAWMMSHLHFGPWAQEMQDTNDNTFLAFLKLQGTGMSIVLLFALAVLPAFGEELLFRGILLRLLHRRVYLASLEPADPSNQDTQRKMLVPVLASALMFSLFHANPYGFIFIFTAGCLLALIYYLTGSLLCSMLAHFLYNGIQVAISLFTEHKASTPVEEADQLPIALVVGGFLVFALSFYTLLRTQRPLAPDWSLDYGPEEK